MNVNIRPFMPDDYEAALGVWNTALPEYAETVAEWQHNDAHRDPKCKHARLLAERDGVMIGYAEYDQFAGMYHPRKFFVFVVVHPEYREQGVGAALYTALITALAPHDPLAVRTQVREDMLRAVRFAESRGFKADMRSWESRLDVQALDFDAFAAVEDRMQAEGIALKTLRELEADPERDHKLFELNRVLARDVPAPEQRTDRDYEQYITGMLGNPDLLPDGYIVALDNGAYVGMSNLWKSAIDDELITGLTGVKREYRRKGIALALKLRALRYARDRGIKTVKTVNESNNRAMLAINEALGFRKQPAWIDYNNVLREETSL